jgi:hypothetical protein
MVEHIVLLRHQIGNKNTKSRKGKTEESLTETKLWHQHRHHQQQVRPKRQVMICRVENRSTRSKHHLPA